MLQREYLVGESVECIQLCVSLVDYFGAHICNTEVRFEVSCGEIDNPSRLVETLSQITDPRGEASLTWNCHHAGEQLDRVRISCDQPGAFVRYNRVTVCR
jgi:hypothetical protein